MMVLICWSLYLDLAKAFDCINHEILLQMPRYYYVAGTSYHWFTSYLFGRSQQVCYHSVLFDSGDVTVGLATTGFNFRPFIFLIC